MSPPGVEALNEPESPAGATEAASTIPETPALNEPETPRGATETTAGPVSATNTAGAIVKVTFGCCILNERCRGHTRSLDQQCPGATTTFIFAVVGSISWMKMGTKKGMFCV